MQLSGYSTRSRIYPPNLGIVLYSGSLVMSSRQEWRAVSVLSFSAHYHQLLPCLHEFCCLSTREDKPTMPVTPIVHITRVNTEPHRVCPIYYNTATRQLFKNEVIESSALTSKHTDAHRASYGLSNHQCHSQWDILMAT